MGVKRGLGGGVSVKPSVCPSVFRNCPSAGILLYVEKHGVGVPHGTVTKHTNRLTNQPNILWLWLFWDSIFVVVVIVINVAVTFICLICCPLTAISPLIPLLPLGIPRHPVHPQNILATASRCCPQKKWQTAANFVAFMLYKLVSMFYKFFTHRICATVAIFFATFHSGISSRFVSHRIAFLKIVKGELRSIWI